MTKTTNIGAGEFTILARIIVSPAVLPDDHRVAPYWNLYDKGLADIDADGFVRITADGRTAVANYAARAIARSLD